MTHALITGAIRGTVTLTDGTVVDVKPDVIFVDSLEVAVEISEQIGLRLEDEGHPAHDPDVPFVYVSPEQAAAQVTGDNTAADTPQPYAATDTTGA